MGLWVSDYIMDWISVLNTLQTHAERPLTERRLVVVSVHRDVRPFSAILPGHVLGWFVFFYLPGLWLTCL
jgi:hypothetical protein